MSTDIELLDEELRRYQELVKVRVEKLLKGRSSPRDIVSSTHKILPRPQVNKPTKRSQEFPYSFPSPDESRERPATVLGRLHSMLVAAIARIEDIILGWFRRW